MIVKCSLYFLQIFLNYATNIIIFTDILNSIQFDGINSTQYRSDYTKPMHGTTCSNLLSPVRQLSSNRPNARIYFSQVQ